MRVDTNVSADVNFGFTNPAAGTYLWEIGDDVSIFMKDEVKEGTVPGPKFLLIPMTIKGVIEGEGEEGQKGSIFITLVTKKGDANGFGEVQMQGILKATGVLKELSDVSKGKDIDPATSPQFAQFLATKLPGKVVKGTHEINLDSNKKERLNFTNITTAPGSATKAAPVEEAASDDDWS